MVSLRPVFWAGLASALRSSPGRPETGRVGRLDAEFFAGKVFREFFARAENRLGQPGKSAKSKILRANQLNLI